MREIILYTGCFSEPDQNAAGKRVLGIALALEKIGYDIILLGKTQKKDNTGKVEYSEHIWFDGLPDYGRIRYQDYFEYIKKYVEKMPKRPKLIIRYSSPGLSIFDYMLNRYSKKTGIPVVADVVDWLSAGGNSILFNVVKTVDTYLEKAVFNKYGTGVIAISSFLAEYYKKFNNNVVTIPPLVSCYTQNNSVNRTVRIVYAGVPFRLGMKIKNTHKTKDRLDLTIEILIELYKEGYRNFLFEIYGITEKDFLVAYPQYQHDLKKCCEVIHFFGRKNMDEVQNIIRESDYTILLREKNRGTMAGFSTKIVESLSCGTPVITTNTSDIGMYIRDGLNGFIIDIDDLRKAKEQMIKVLTASSSEIQNMKDNCYKMRTFEFTQYVESLESFINNITQN